MAALNDRQGIASINQHEARRTKRLAINCKRMSTRMRTRRVEVAHQHVKVKKQLHNNCVSVVENGGADDL
jgi:hypothetical protein